MAKKQRWSDQQERECDALIDSLGVSLEPGIPIPMSACEEIGAAVGKSAKAVWNRIRRKQGGKGVCADDALVDKVYRALLKRSYSLGDLATKLKAEFPSVLGAVATLRERHVNVQDAGGLFHIPKTLNPACIDGTKFDYTSRPDNTFVFGAIGDNHYGSKYAREDAVESLYDEFATAGVDRVYHCGNWIDGETRFNKNDLLVHGMDAQCRYLAEKYPQRPGIVTYAVAGDDHEGWYAQREGVNIGRYQETAFRDAGRDDWVDLGYMEAHIRLLSATTGATSTLAVLHPGGGSAYSDSYKPQKLIESLEGGEKPGVMVYGHYHKMFCGNTRNVWHMGVGCCQDQTPFARKKQLRFDIGGLIVRLTMDPESGAIVRCGVEMFRYFNRGFYNHRWSHSGPVTLPERGAA